MRREGLVVTYDPGDYPEPYRPSAECPPFITEELARYWWSLGRLDAGSFEEVWEKWRNR